MMDEGPPPPPPPHLPLSSSFSRSSSFGPISANSSPAVPSRREKKNRDGEQEGWNVPLWKILWGGDNEEKNDSQSTLKRGTLVDRFDSCYLPLFRLECVSSDSDIIASVSTLLFW
jgi:hypothetical protein